MTDSKLPPRPVLVLRSALFTLVMITTVLVFAPLVVLMFPFPFEWRYAVATRWARLNLRWLKISCRLGYEVEGRENIPAQASIVFSKHQSAWETLALQEIFPPQVWVLKRELLWLPFFGWALALLEPIAIDRKAGRKAVEQLVNQGCRRLEKGRWVIVFPEGTRVAPGTRGRYRIGGAVLAERCGGRVVPVAHNAGEYWRRRAFIKYPGTIRVVIGPPIETSGKTAQQILEQAEAWIEGTMAKITTLGSTPPHP